MNNEVVVKLILQGADAFKRDADNALGKLQKTGGTLGGTMAKFGKVAAAGFAAVSASLAVVGGAALKTAGDFESMQVSLRTALGGTQKDAEKMFDSLTKFASKTPLQTEEVVRSFVKLKNMGLDPSEEALRSYGDTASAMGKSLNDMVEAVADAATGEFERLKEFGIKARVNGDKVKFTFKGVTTSVGKNSKEIEKYLLRIGNTDFAGGMLLQSTTLKGLLSTLKDDISIALNRLANDTGLLNFSKTVVKQVSSAVSGASGIIGAFFEIMRKPGQGTTGGLSSAFNVDPKIISAIQSLQKKIESFSKSALVKNMMSAWSKFAEVLRNTWLETVPEIVNMWDTQLKPALQDFQDRLTKSFGNTEQFGNFANAIAFVISTVIMSIMLLITAFIRISTFILEMDNRVRNVLNSIKNFFVGIWTFLTTTFTGLLNSIKYIFTHIPEIIGASIAWIITQFYNLGVHIAQFAANAYVFFKTLPDRMRSLWATLWIWIFVKIKELSQNFKLFFETTLPKLVSDGMKRIKDGIASIPSAFKNAANGSMTYFEGMLNRMIGGWNSLADAKGNPMPHVDNVAFPRFASGGVVGGSSYSGDKVMARVNSGEMILNRGQQAALFAMLKNMGNKPNINFNGGVNFTSNSQPMQQQNNFMNMLKTL